MLSVPALPISCHRCWRHLYHVIGSTGTSTSTLKSYVHVVCVIGVNATSSMSSALLRVMRSLSSPAPMSLSQAAGVARTNAVTFKLLSPVLSAPAFYSNASLFSTN